MRPKPHRCWADAPWMAQDIWASRVRSGPLYWQAIAGSMPIVLLDRCTLPLPEPGCGENSCTCVGSPKWGEELIWPRVWHTDPVFPSGPWAYTVDLCGPYVLLNGSPETEDYGDRFGVPTPYLYGDDNDLPDDDGILWTRWIRPVWDVIVVPNEFDPLYLRVEAFEEQISALYERALEEIYEPDDVDILAEAVAVMLTEGEGIALINEIQSLLKAQQLDWAWMLTEVGDECSSSQSRLLEQPRLAS